MAKPIFVSAIILGLVLVVARPAWGQIREELDPETNEKVATAISSGIEYLRRSAKGATWIHDAGMAANEQQNIGATALAAIALLEAQVPLNDPQIEAALAAVRNAAPK